mmetsp:Transcript_30038/g.65605  ORF Transcript_30038/g.65605 Transcript_30038/m.65605 type:complete len:104 (-) Transcript_30038:197-508(-)
MQSTVFWALYFTAIEIENPFQEGEVTSNYDAQEAQKEFNAQLLLIIDPKSRSVPKLSDKFERSIEILRVMHDEHEVGHGESGSEGSLSLGLSKPSSSGQEVET